ncbi:Uroporphyrin-III C/tetrapyrrole (Corrin/Porphyrin) methyltransferase [Oceanithermus profundus DSM 14977]|uniref:Ribosomal RNA small subunit methyltransferase I n=1 Tax=Oceanithermus profundus (strain DSM 14977 / NBRC 100410 / VKM B-2274 / 506) TaxID=670487 RepID=E4U4T2_OCEP5|nr:16S rRNA (cytidine(1402)-2'-O)-methyltransferase [Oceanithermus profundus]ADR37149.1 Uroporphyrin-III C/tetrapyrrole (Corrin/Porphyrin) methyltransferase [Oceanithermus profundus DSM 14977]
MRKLVLVPTPIGHLADVTLRALEVLKEAEVVACEDTRRTAKLLRHYGIATPLVRVDQHTLDRAERLLEEHAYVAYASDAGTPGISDPGAELVARALARGFRVEVLPGPTAFVPALVASGLPTARFVFEGFLPTGRARRPRLEALRREARTVVLYEAPHRLERTLSDLLAIYGPDHPVALARELSKKHEEIWRGRLEEALARFRKPRGEFVIVLGPRELPEDRPDAAALAAELAAEGLGGRALAEALEARSVPRNEARKWAYRKEKA